MTDETRSCGKCAECSLEEEGPTMGIDHANITKPLMVAEGGFILLGEMDDFYAMSQLRSMALKFRGLLADLQSKESRRRLRTRFDPKEMKQIDSALDNWRHALVDIVEAMEMLEKGWCELQDVHDIRRDRADPGDKEEAKEEQ